jgi:4-amino-4-deoxy-L-arabinose transferase-like glycosyltransferase
MKLRIGRWWWVLGLAIAALVVIILAPLASSDPDGLNKVAEDHGFIGAARDAVYHIIPGYEVPGLDGHLSKVVAGLIGVAVVFGVMFLLGRLLARRRQAEERP